MKSPVDRPTFATSIHICYQITLCDITPPDDPASRFITAIYSRPSSHTRHVIRQKQNTTLTACLGFSRIPIKQSTVGQRIIRNSSPRMVKRCKDSRILYGHMLVFAPRDIARCEQRPKQERTGNIQHAALTRRTMHPYSGEYAILVVCPPKNVPGPSTLITSIHSPFSFLQSCYIGKPLYYSPKTDSNF